MFAAKKSGMDLTTFWHAIRASAGNSFLWETAGPNIFRGEYHESFALDLQCKDIQLCYEMARQAKASLHEHSVGALCFKKMHFFFWEELPTFEQALKS